MQKIVDIENEQQYGYACLINWRFTGPIKSIEIYKSRVAERLRCQNEYSVSEN